jgi:hypothetical protein
MYISRISIPRRTFLRGAGAALALPFLDAMVPSLTASAQTAAAGARRVGFVYVPNGAILEQWTPADAGAGFQFTPILEPLEPFRRHVTVVSNLFRPGLDPDHAPSSAGWLSSAVAKETEGQDFRAGTTIDQVIARQIGQETPFPSLEVATEDFTGYVGGCSPGYACTYVNTLSWATPSSPLPLEINPRVLFERLFGQPGTPEERLARLRTRRSMLDSVASDLRRLEQRIGEGDRQRLGRFLDHIREIERRIERTEERSDQLALTDAPIGIPPSYEEHVTLLYDLLAVALQSDLTRVFTFMMAREFSMRTYPEVGVSEPHHSVSHHQNKPDKIALHAAINRYHVQLFSRFIEKLAAIEEGDGSLLDRSLIFYGAGMGNGNTHSPLSLPLLAIGGEYAGDRHVPADEVPIGNLWVGVARRFGSQVEALGESTGILEL